MDILSTQDILGLPDMYVVMVYDHRKRHQFDVGWPLDVTEKLLGKISARLSNPAPMEHDDDDPHENQRQNQLVVAEFINLIKNFKKSSDTYFNDPGNSKTMKSLVIAVTFSFIAHDIRKRVQEGKILQISVPNTPASKIDYQWVRKAHIKFGS